MTIKPPLSPPQSLIERATQSYNMDFFRSRDSSAVVEPRASEPRASEPMPSFQDPQTANPPRTTTIPAAPYRIASIEWARLREGGFIVPGSTPNTLSEEFRLIKRALLIAATGGPKSTPVVDGRMILVCSAQPNEGKTFTAVNLALSLSSEQDYEVLLVDADFAKPEILSTLGLPGTLGLMDALIDPTRNVENFIIQTDVPKLKVLPAGSAAANDTEALASAHAHSVFQGLMHAQANRIVVIDSAPALATSLASVLAHHVGQVVMVVRADQTSEPVLQEALGQLNGCPHIQLMLNSVTYFGNARKYGTYYGLGD